MSVVEPAFCKIMFQRVYLHNSEKPSPRSSLNLDYLNLSRSESPSSIASTSDLALTLDSRDSRSVHPLVPIFSTVLTQPKGKSRINLKSPLY